ncbi:hypothetical protein RGD00_03645 [Xinfangfangia sp. LG-4]|uniref:UGSC-like domain-containing protein n=3 Tax=Ruixingdingia sedimenti TaxID=3073604 RepID=A0ABU1F5G9_9RHOB|nr:hypothetical protein [Xinfangfangia sp. LG-4]MDR5651684.1 hypothetical protein [Xinfangfangia sp. LG-4]
MIKRGIPAVVFVTERFTALARAARTGKGMPDLPSIILPLNPQFYPEGEVQRVAEGVIDAYVDLIAPDRRRTGQEDTV